MTSEIYIRYGNAVAYVAVEKPNGDHDIGSAFHVGEGVFITARHVVEHNKILSICTTTRSRVSDPAGKVTIHINGKFEQFTEFRPNVGRLRSGPYFHPDPSVDVAAIIVDNLDAPVIELGGHLDDWLDDAFMLSPVTVMGYPPIPFSREPLLVAANAEINAIVDKRGERHPHFVISAMARGGFSGGPCLIDSYCLGVITEALIANHKPAELGFMAVLTVEPIFTCLQHHHIVPKIQKEGWEGLWD